MLLGGVCDAMSATVPVHEGGGGDKFVAKSQNPPVLDTHFDEFTVISRACSNLFVFTGK